MGEPLQVLEGSDLEISRLFPKCRPRHPISPSNPAASTDTCQSDLNLNYVRDSDDNDNFELAPNRATVSTAFDEDLTTQDRDDSSVSSASRMSVDSATATSSSSTPASHSESHSSASSHSAQVERSLPDADLSVVSAYRDFEEPVPRSSVLDSSYEDSPSHHNAAPTQPNSISRSHNLPHVRREHFRLRDSRIEAAGGREVFSQSRSRPARRRHEESRRANHNRSHHHMHLHHSHHHASHHLQQLQQPSQHLSQLLIEESRRATNSSRSNSTSSSSSTSSNSTNNSSSISGSQASHSTESGQADDGHHSGDALQPSTRERKSPLVYEAPLAGSTEVVFDDIGEWVTRGLTVRGLQEHSLKGKQASSGDAYIHSLSQSDPESDSESEQALARVTKIGNVPIAEYEGSPRRYGPRAASRHHSPRALHLLTGMHRTPRPGFPRRVTSSDDQRSKEALLQKDKLCQPIWEKPNPPLPSHKEKLSPNIESRFRDKLSVNPPQERTSPSKKSKSHSSKDRPLSPRDKNTSHTKSKLDDLHKLLSSSNSQEPVNQKHTTIPEPLPENLHEREKEPVTTMPPALSVSSEHCDPEDTKSGEESGASTPPVISISTLSSTYSSTLSQQQPSTASCDNYIDNYEYSFEVSETRKVLEEFFKDSENKRSLKDFSDLEYTLKRQHGNSYVGQRLAAEYEDEAQADEEECVEDFKHDEECADVNCTENEKRVDDCAISKSTVMHENGESLQDHEMEVSRNFTLSPETTSCDSGDVESEFSAGEAEGSLHSSSRGLCSTMPVLEDGLSSGEESDIVPEQNCYLSADNIHTIALTHHPLLEQQLLTQRNTNHSERFPTNQIISADHNLEAAQDPAEEGENSKVYQRARSLDEQLCRGELPPMANSFQASPATVASSSTSLSPAEPYSCGISSPIPHANSHRLNSCEEEQVPNHLSPQCGRNSLPNSTSPHGKLSGCGGSSCNKVISGHYGTNHSPSSSTLSLMKKQITEIEREIALKRPEATLRRVDGEVPQPPLDLHLLDPLTEKMGEPPPPPAPHPHRNSNEVGDNDVSSPDHIATANSASPSRTIGHLHSPQYTPVSCPISSPQLITSLGSITSPGQVTPHMVPGHPATHDLQHKPGSVVSPSRESVEAAIADIKQAIKRTKNLPLKTHHLQQEKHAPDKQPVWVPRSNRREPPQQSHPPHSNPTSPQSQAPHRPPQPHGQQQQQQESSPSAGSTQSRDRSIHDEDDGDTDQETDRLLGQQRSDDPGFVEDKSWRRPKGRPVMPRYLAQSHKEAESEEGGANSTASSPSTPVIQSHICPSKPSPSPPQDPSSNKAKTKKEKDSAKKKGRSKEVLIEGVLFRARYLGSTQLVSEGQPTKTTRMMQAEEAVSRIKAPEGEAQPSTEVDLFISTEKIMVLNTDLKEIMMDHALRTISYIADIGDLVVLMARRRVLPTEDQGANGSHKAPKMICHVFESDEAQFIAQSIGQAFQVAYLEFLKANGIEDHSFVKEMDYQEVLNSQEIFGDELQMFAKKELQKEVVVPKMKGEILGVVVVESGWGSMVPTVVIANLSPTGAAAKCGQLNIGDQIIAINGISLVGLPLSTCQNYIKNTKYNTAVKLTVVPCPPVVEVKIRRPDTKYQLGFSVQNGVICSLLRGGIAERGGVRVGHRIIDINSQSVVAVPHDKIVNLLATSVGEIRMKTMPTSIFRLLTGQETPQYI